MSGHESEPTSDWSLVAREFEELYSRRNANDDFNVSLVTISIGKIDFFFFEYPIVS